MPPVLNWKLSPSQEKIETFQLLHSVNSLDAVSLMLPSGAYTTFRTYSHTKALRLDDHMRRLEDSAERVHQHVRLSKTRIRAALRYILHESPFSEARVRITLDLENEPGCLYFSLEELRPLPEDVYLQGVKVLTRVMHRDNPRAKLTTFIAAVSDFRSHLPAGVNEVLMVADNGLIMEGLSSNFFGVMQGSLYTADEGVLPGITRSLVLEEAELANVPVKLTGIPLDKLHTIDECFITSASRAVLPVVEIDDVVIQNGKPGPITQILRSRYLQRIKVEAQDI